MILEKYIRKNGHVYYLAVNQSVKFKNGEPVYELNVTEVNPMDKNDVYEIKKEEVDDINLVTRITTVEAEINARINAAGVKSVPDLRLIGLGFVKEEI